MTYHMGERFPYHTQVSSTQLSTLLSWRVHAVVLMFHLNLFKPVNQTACCSWCCSMLTSAKSMGPHTHAAVCHTQRRLIQLSTHPILCMTNTKCQQVDLNSTARCRAQPFRLSAAHANTGSSHVSGKQKQHCPRPCAEPKRGHVAACKKTTPT
jgi:hypothetical protein